MVGGAPDGYNKAGGLGVPLFTSPTLIPADAAPKPRSTEAEVWALILEDVNFALTNLPAASQTGRVNANVARALQARMHLLRGEWAEAEAAATAVIDSKKYSLLPAADYGKIWLSQNSTEAIWELQFDVNNSNSIAFFYYTAATGGRNEITTAASLRDAHDPADVRKPVNATTTAPTNKTQKFTRVNGTDNVVIIRLSEMYLIRAEARARQAGKLSDAIVDLNTIRNRAGLASITLATADAAVTAILAERRFEFAHEGLRWFDLRRTGNWSVAGITDGLKAVWPIPQREVQTSANVVAQNPGY